MRILLVKLSSLGDIVHTLPVVQDILAAIPDAQIDWVLEKSFAPLLTQVKGLRRIIPCELRRWRKSIWTAQTRSEWRDFKADLQTCPYDAIIDLQGLSKSAVVSRLARVAPQGKRYAMANQTDGSGYEVPTRWAADITVPLNRRLHAVARGRQLASAALGYSFQNTINYGLKVFEADDLWAQAAPEKVAKKILFIHGTSRLDKTWPLQHWVDLGQRMAASGYQVSLLHGNATELATSQSIAVQLPGNARVLPLLSLHALTREMACCTGAIGVDSGVSHMAVALGLPHVQIYNFDTAWRTGPQASSHQVSVFAPSGPSVDTVYQAWLACESAAP